MKQDRTGRKGYVLPILSLKILTLVLFFLVCPGQDAFTQTIRYVKPNGTGNGTSWNDASGSIMDMIDASAKGDQVWVAAGEHMRDDRHGAFYMKDGVAVYGGFNGTESSLAERDHKKNVTILVGNIINYLNKVTRAALLDGFTIMRGGMQNIRASPTIVNCRFLLCRSFIGGAAMYNNVASPLIINCTFAGNDASEGAGIFNENDSRSVIINCVFYGNVANGGAAIENKGSDAVIINCTIAGNYSHVSGAGAIENLYCSPYIANCII
mgnify:FL=1